MSKQDNKNLQNVVSIMLSRINEPLPKIPKPRWYDSVKKWELLLLAWKHGVVSERERVVKVAEHWISEMLGHDGECSCKHEANILQQFIDHPDFKGEK